MLWTKHGTNTTIAEKTDITAQDITKQTNNQC